MDDVYNTGYVKPSDLVYYMVKGNKQLGWNTGVMFWQYYSDQDGTVINELSQVLKSLSYK